MVLSYQKAIVSLYYFRVPFFYLIYYRELSRLKSNLVSVNFTDLTSLSPRRRARHGQDGNAVIHTSRNTT